MQRYIQSHPAKGISNPFFRALLFLTIFFISLCFSGFSQSWIQLGDDIEGQQNWESSGYFIAMSDEGTTVIIGAPYNDEVAEDAGKARVYHWEASSWVQKGSDIDGQNAFDELGYSVGISSDGNIVAVGAIQDLDQQRSTGYVRVLEWSGSDWVQMGDNMLGEIADDRFGTSVSLSDDGYTVAAGSRNGPNGEESGSVKVFGWNGSAWARKGQDLAGEEIWDSKGWSLCLDSEGNTLIVGVPQDGNEYPGFVQVYSWNETNWEQKGQSLYGDANGDRFGWATSISADGNTVAIGARQNSGNGEQSGQLKVFSWNGAQWEQKGASIYGSESLKLLGWSTGISADGNTVVVGAPSFGTEKGSAEVYAWNNSQWEIKGGIIEGDIAGNRSGWSVALSSGGDFVAIATPWYSGNSGAGQVKVYSYGFTSVPQNFTAGFSVYPNPAKDKVHISSQAEGKIELGLFDLNGKQILVRSCRLSNGEDYLLQIGNVTPGLYILRVGTVSGYSFNKLVVGR